MDFLEIIKSRDLLKQCTDISELAKFLSENTCAKMYIGFDCTANSLHVGSLIQIILLRWFQKCGYKPVILLGGATTRIGDPSGKTKERVLLHEKEIEHNLESIRKIFKKFLSFDTKNNSAVIVNNMEWLKNINYIDFLSKYGKLFSVNRMLSFESIKTRLKTNLTFLEFNYMILQAYDFMTLASNYNCKIQAGGSDQWGNILSGIEISRKLGITPTYGITTNLLLNSSGQKMGKTENGPIWLDEQLCSPYEYWQYFRNIPDAEVFKMLNMLTYLSLDEINEIKNVKNINVAKILLANEVTKICHGEDASRNAASKAKKVFYSQDLNIEDDEIIINKEEQQLKIHEFLKKHNIFDSAKKAKDALRAGSIKANSDTINSINITIKILREKHGNKLKITIAKKKHLFLKCNDKI